MFLIRILRDWNNEINTATTINTTADFAVSQILPMESEDLALLLVNEITISAHSCNKNLKSCFKLMLIHQRYKIYIKSSYI